MAMSHTFIVAPAEDARKLVNQDEHASYVAFEGGGYPLPQLEELAEVLRASKKLTGAEPVFEVLAEFGVEMTPVVMQISRPFVDALSSLSAQEKEKLAKAWLASQKKPKTSRGKGRPNKSKPNVSNKDSEDAEALAACKTWLDHFVTAASKAKEYRRWGKDLLLWIEE
jgi:hypothetical protein